MIKIFGDGVAIDPSEIAAVTINEGRDCGRSFYYVEAYLKNGGEFELAIFQNEEDAELYFEKVVNEVNKA